MADLNVAIEMIGRDNASGPVAHVVQALSGIGQAAEKQGGFLSSLTGSLGKIGLAGIGFQTLATSIGGFATSLVSGNAEMETYETQLGTLMGSADGAKERLKELADFGARTPFELPEIAAAEKVLLGFGLTGEKVMKLTGQSASQFRETVGDVAAGTGVSFQEIALTMGKFSAGATGEAISRLQEMGVATREQLAGMGVEFSKSGELLSPLPVAMQAITQLAQQKFGGGMDKLSKTFSGQMSTLSDGFNQAKVAIMQPVFEVLRNSLASVNEFIASGSFQKGIQSLAQVIAGLVDRGINLAVQGFQLFRDTVSQVIANIGPTIQMLSERFTTFFTSLAQGEGLARTVNAAFGDLIPPGLNPILDAVDVAFSNIKNTFVGLVATVQQGGLAAVWQQVTAAMAEFAPTGERIQSAMSAIGSAIIAIVPQPIQDFVTNLVSMAGGATAGASPMQTLADILNTVSGAIASATQFVKDHVAVQALLAGAFTATAAVIGVNAAVNAGLAAYNTALAVGQAAVKAYSAVQIALNVILSANPIGIVVVALAGLTAALIYAYQNSEEFRRVVDEAFAAMRDIVVTALQVGSAALTTFQTVITRTIGFIQTFQSNTASAFGAINTVVVGAMTTISSSVNTGWTSINNLITTSISNIQQTITNGFNAINNTVETIQGQIQQAINTVWNALPEDIRSDLQLIYTHISTQFGLFRDKVAEEMGNIQTKINTVWQTIQGRIQTVLGAIGQLITQKWNEIQTAVQTAMTVISEVINSGWEVVKSVVGTAMEAVRASIDAKWNEAKALTETVMGAIQTVVSSAWEAVRAAIEEKVNAAMDLIRKWGKDLGEFLDGLKETVSGLASSLGQSIVNGIKAGMGGVWQAFVDWATQQIRDLLASMARAIGAKSPSQMAAEQVGIPIMQGITQGIVREAPNTVKAAQDSATAIIAAFSGGGGAPGGAVPIWAGLPGIVGGIWGAISHAIRDNTEEIVNGIEGFKGEAITHLEGLEGWIADWINRAVAHRTELLKRFNYAAFLRGEGTKVLPELQSVTEKYIKNTEEAVAQASTKLQKIAKDLQADIAEARAEAAKAAEAAIAQADAQVRQLRLNASLQAEIKMQREAFAEIQRIQKEHFDTSQKLLHDRLRQSEQVARINFQAQLKLGRVGQEDNPAVTAAQATLDTQTELARIAFQEQRDLQRASTQEEKDEVTARAKEAQQALQDRLAEEKYVAEATQKYRLDLQRQTIEAEKAAALQALKDQQAEELAIQNETSNLRNIIAERERLFNQEVKRQQEVFEKSMEEAALQRQINNIYAERDIRIQAIATALADKEAQISKAAEEERQIILDNLKQQLEDYQKEYIDEIVAAFHHAQVDIADFLHAIHEDLAKETKRHTDDILDMVRRLNEARQTLGNTPGYIPQGPPQSIPNPIYPIQYEPRGPSVIGQPALTRNLTVNVTSSVPMTVAEVQKAVERSILLA